MSITAIAGQLVEVNLLDLEPMNNKQDSVDLPSLPPRLPQSEAELKRTIILLGNRKQVELKTDARRQLESLIGVYPDYTRSGSMETRLTSGMPRKVSNC